MKIPNEEKELVELCRKVKGKVPKRFIKELQERYGWRLRDELSRYEREHHIKEQVLISSDGISLCRTDLNEIPFSELLAVDSPFSGVTKIWRMDRWSHEIGTTEEVRRETIKSCARFDRDAQVRHVAIVHVIRRKHNIEWVFGAFVRSRWSPQTSGGG